MAVPEIMLLLDRFISGADISLKLANRLGVLLDDSFPDDDYLQETVEILASYRPEGGEWVLGTETVQRRLVETKAYLSRHH